MKALTFFLSLLLGIQLTLAFDYQHPLKDDEAAIAYLLDEVEKSQGVFLRNGSEHSAKEAKKHLAHKMKMARSMFWFFGPKKDISLQEFIEKIASQSSTSNKDYQIRLKSGETVKTGDWLRSKILELRQANQKTP